MRTASMPVLKDKGLCRAAKIQAFLSFTPGSGGSLWAYNCRPIYRRVPGGGADRPVAVVAVVDAVARGVTLGLRRGEGV